MSKVISESRDTTGRQADVSASDSDCSGQPVLVTGAAGFVGSSLCRRLLEEGYQVYAVDNLVTGNMRNILPLTENSCFHFRNMDVNDTEFVETFRAIPIRKIYHLACPTGVPNIDILAMEMLTTCSIGTLNVAEIAHIHGASLLFTSSCEVYGQPEVFPQTPEYTGNVSPVGPRCPYEEGKRFSESVVITYVRKRGVNAKIVRLFNAYGPLMSPTDQRVIPSFLRCMRDKKPLRVYGDGLQTRTFTFVTDLLNALTLIMDSGEAGGVYNIGNTAQVTMKELAETMIALTGYDGGLENVPHFTEDHNRREPDNSLLLSLGWKPTVGLREGLEAMITQYPESPYFQMTEKEELTTVAV